MLYACRPGGLCLKANGQVIDRARGGGRGLLLNATIRVDHFHPLTRTTGREFEYLVWAARWPPDC